MTTYNTGNAIGSSDARDLYDNAENIDNFANGSANTFNDRLGVTRKSLAGMNAAFDDFIESSGYTVPVAYTSGIVLTEYNQLIEYNDEFYKLKAGQAPYTTTGTWGTDSAKLVAVGDAALRQELADDDGASKIGYMSAGTGAVSTDVQSKLRESVSVKDFGATGDGVADDTAAIQDAIDYAETLVQQITTNYDIATAQVLIPPGRYRHTGILLSQTVDGVQLVGHGAGVSVLEYDGSGVGVTIGTETGAPNFSHVWLRDLTLRGGSPAYTGNDANIVTGSTGIKVSRLNRNCGLERVQVFGHDTNVNLRDCWTFKIRDCHIHDAKTYQIDWQTALNGEITGTRIDDCGGDVMVIIDAQGTSNQIRDFRLVGNAFQESDGKAVRFIDVSSAYVESNHFENNNKLDATGHSEIEFITGSDNRIDGTLTLVNNYYSPGAATWTGTEYAVHVTAAKQVVAIGEKTGSSAFNRYMRVSSTVENVDILGCVFTNLGSGDPVLRDATTTTLTERWTRVDSSGATVETVSRKTAGTYEAIDGRGLHGRVSTTTGSISTDPYRAFFNMAGNGQTLTLRTEEEFDGFSIVVRKYSTSGQLTVVTAGASLISLNGSTNNSAVLNAARGAAIFTFDGSTGNWVCMPMDEAAGWALAA